MPPLLSLCAKAVSTAIAMGASEAEAFGIDRKEMAVALERNDIKVCRTQTRTGVGLRVFKSSRMGFASLNLLSEQGLEGMVRKAVKIAANTPKDRFNGLPSPLRLGKVPGLYDRKSEGLDSSVAFEQANMMLASVRDYDRRVVVDSGEFNCSIGETAISTSTGIHASEKDSAFMHYMLAFAREGGTVGSFDSIFDGAHSLRDIDVGKSGAVLAERVVNSLHTKKAESFRGQVLLTPSAVQGLLASPIEFSVDANSVQKGLSRFAGKMGTAVASKRLTVRDDGRIPGGLASSSFDREGIPRRPLDLIRNGRLCGFMHNSYTARKEGVESTGHAAGSQRGVPSIGATNFVMEPGRRGRDDIIGGMERGILVTRISGWPDESSGDFSSVVKGGFFIKGGKVMHPVRETMLSGNSYELLGRITEASKETEQVYNYRLPHLLLEDVSVTGG